MSVVERWVRHSPFSDPGRYADRLPVGDVGAVGEGVREMVVHYRAGGGFSADARVDLRWVEAILGAAGDGPVAGCCRDFALVTVAALRAQGVAARPRVGFAGYLEEGFHTDHVVAEYHDGGRWVRVDTQFAPGAMGAVDLGDLPDDDPRVFVSAARAWAGYRAGELDGDRFGVAPELPLRGGWLIGDYVWSEAAHRCGCEVLLWDSWEALGPWADDARTDAMAAALIAGDEERIGGLWQEWGPRGRVWCSSPSGFRGWVDLEGDPGVGVGS
ncbi:MULTISPECIES: transglutaminase-like domain-containing protein [unclassified Nocardiopsis]|uniref:transglutaminase-like domain-containing protein n=1 Tax=Nocardiopsis TaxID=2013 RepID=UPI00387B1557